MLTDRETELRDAYLKGYEDKAKYNDKLVVDRYELAERYAVNQAKNNEVLDLVSKRFEVWSVTHNNMVKSFEHRETAELCINVISSVDTEYEIIEVTVC